MLGSFFALVAAATFAWTNAAVRRGVLSGSVAQAMTLSIPVGVPVFFAALLVSGQTHILPALPRTSLMVFAAVGVSHFVVGRYCNYRAIRAIGTNLAGPMMQSSLLVSLALAIFFLGETLTLLRIVGIVLIVAAPVIVSRDKAPVAPVVTPPAFIPRFAEGYVFAFLSALCYGASPALVRYAIDGRGLAAAFAGGMIASAAATVCAVMLLLVPGRWHEVSRVNPEAAKWFLSSGVMVYVSQMFVYMAVALAPVTVTAPIIGLNNVFRLYFSRWLNPDHEVFGPKVVIATGVSFLGVVVLSASTETLPLPAAWSSLLNWHWP